MSRHTNGPVRLGVVGVGAMGQGHCAKIQQVEEVQLAAVCDTRAEVVKKIAAEYGVPAFTDYQAMFDAGLCDAVLVATPHPAHTPVALAALRAGLHLLCEKPLAETLSDADKIVAAAKAAGVTFAVMFQRRFEPPFAKAAELVRAGKIGKLYRATLISPEFRTQAYYDSGGWRATWAGEGGGVMLNQSPHVLDLFVRLAGMPCAVYGRTETRMHHIEVEDLAEAMLRYPDGGTGYFYCSTCETGLGQMIELYGDKGKLTYRDGTLTCVSFSPGVEEYARTTTEIWGRPATTPELIELSTEPTNHATLVRNFARNILRGEPLVAPGEEGLRSLELANAVWLSSHLGKEVTLPLDRAAYDAFLAKKRRASTFVKTVRGETVTDPTHK